MAVKSFRFNFRNVSGGDNSNKLYFLDETKQLCMSLHPCCIEGKFTDVNTGAKKIQDHTNMVWYMIIT